ncbi:MAG: hypothetical protein KF713_09720 [Turneriella sp.]|nr:hypothetical protein [Turneriella sp.]
MILVHLLLILVVLVALVIQLITPLVLNIPVMAVCLLVLIFTLWSFRRARRNSKVPFVAALALLVQSILFIVSIAILVVVTIPNERPEDSPAVVQGIRKFLVAQGIIEKPKTVAPPIVSPTAEKKAAETVNAPDASKIQIKIDGDEEKKVNP